MTSLREVGGSADHDADELLIILTFVLGLAGMLAMTTGPPALLRPDSARMALLLGAGGLCEGFQQRAHLDVASEHGVLWGVWLLRHAHWYVRLLTLFDGPRTRRIAYSITRKTGPTGREGILLRAHGPTLVLDSLGAVRWRTK